jgi:hypothetical protein
VHDLRQVQPVVAGQVHLRVAVMAADWLGNRLRLALTNAANKAIPDKDTGDD